MLHFEVLAGIADLNGRAVLDAGCGYADLYPFLKSRFPEIAGYSGIEQMPEMISRAKERFPDINLQQGDFMRKKLTRCDYILASGSLNYGQDIYPAIRKSYNASTLGLALTFCGI